MLTLNLLVMSLSVLSVGANTPIPQSTLDSEGLYPFVVASRPKWWFGIPSKALCPSRTAPCYPEAAINHTTGAQNSGQNLCDWPNANCGCQYPSENGQAGGTKARPFPHYYIASQCSGDEVRAGYWVYYPKDGFVGSGHRHDWESYIVIWSKQSDDTFIRTSHVFSYHSGRLQESWSSASTVDDDLNATADGEGNHALVYPGWSKHPNFPNKNTNFCDTLSQSTKNAYRSDDWWYYAEETDLFNADNTTQIGSWIASIGTNWGSADSYPPKFSGSAICDLNGTGGTLRTASERNAVLDSIDAVTLSDLEFQEPRTSFGKRNGFDHESC